MDAAHPSDGSSVDRPEPSIMLPSRHQVIDRISQHFQAHGVPPLDWVSAQVMHAPMARVKVTRLIETRAVSTQVVPGEVNSTGLTVLPDTAALNQVWLPDPEELVDQEWDHQIGDEVKHRDCTCQGGYLVCPECVGEGTTPGGPCSECDGSGKLPCPLCAATGRVTSYRRGRIWRNRSTVERWVRSRWSPQPQQVQGWIAQDVDPFTLDRLSGELIEPVADLLQPVPTEILASRSVDQIDLWSIVSEDGQLQAWWCPQSDQVGSPIMDTWVSQEVEREQSGEAELARKTRARVLLSLIAVATVLVLSWWIWISFFE